MQNFRTDEALETPYRRARQIIDDRVGSARVQAHNWRLAALGAVAVAGISVLGLIYQSSKAAVIPYIVEVDGQGAVRLVGAANTQVWKPTEGIKRHFLEEWVLNVREVSSDEKVIRQKLLNAYKGVTGAAKAQLDTLIQAEKPFEMLGQTTRQVKFSSINHVSDDSYRVEWSEPVFGKDGYVDRVEEFVGIVTLVHITPTTREQMERNPLGIYVSHFSLNQRIAKGGEE